MQQQNEVLAKMLVDNNPFQGTIIGVLQAEKANNDKYWFSHRIQSVLAVETAHKIIQKFPDIISPAEAVRLAKEVNDELFQQVIRPKERL